MRLASILGFAGAALLLGSGAVYAQAAPAATAPATINFTAGATMPSLTDASKDDHFTVGISDPQVATTLTLTCQAGHNRLLVIHTNRACGVSGTGMIINPGNGQKLPRAQYVGGYTVEPDGSSQGSTMSVNYLSVGKVPASTTQFGGSMNLRPENTSTGAAALRDTILKKLNDSNSAGGVIDKRVDTVDINQLFIPSAGFPSDKGCTWNGNMVFAYQTNSWFLSLTANCDNKSYTFKGNMPWTKSPNAEQQTQYDLTLTEPNAQQNSDDALFASGDANADLFASVDGISGQIIMKESNYVTTQVDGQDTTTPAQVDASGSLKGSNVPLDTVRSLGVLFGLLSENLFGA